MRMLMIAGLAGVLGGSGLAARAATAETSLHLFKTVALSPNGAHVAAIESDDLPSDTEVPVRLLIHDLAGNAVAIPLPCDGKPGCIPSSPAWSHDGSRLAFLIEEPGGATSSWSVVASQTRLHQRARTLCFHPAWLDSMRKALALRHPVTAMPEDTRIELLVPLMPYPRLSRG